MARGIYLSPTLPRKSNIWSSSCTDTYSCYLSTRRNLTIWSFCRRAWFIQVLPHKEQNLMEWRALTVISDRIPLEPRTNFAGGHWGRLRDSSVTWHHWEACLNRPLKKTCPNRALGGYTLSLFSGSPPELPLHPKSNFRNEHWRHLTSSVKDSSRNKNESRFT